MLVHSIVFMTVLMLAFVIVLMLVMLHADELECARNRVNARDRVRGRSCSGDVRVCRV